MRPDDGRPPGESRLLRRTRIGLALWSGAITLVVLLLLGLGLYLVVERQLATGAEDRLRSRAAMITDAIADSGATGPNDPVVPGLGYEFGGPSAGTFAFIVEGEERLAPPVPVEPVRLDLTQPTEDGSHVALSVPTGTTADGIWVGNVEGTPARVLTVGLETPPGEFAVGIVSDRTAELDTLDRLALVLFVAIPLVAVAAGIAGWIYSRRALVPIKRSLERQRRFASDASHELRTPLAVLGGSLETVRQAGPPSAEASAAVEDAIGVTEQMGVLVDDLLLLARGDVEAVRDEGVELDLADAAAAALDTLSGRAAERGVRLVLDVEPTPMRGDPRRLRRLITALADNAVRHGRVNGTVWVRVRPRDGHASLVVEDDGPGIAEGQRERIFDRFWRGSTTTEGHGLGLAIARGISEAHGGSISVGESPGGGARFEVTLPG